MKISNLILTFVLCALLTTLSCGTSGVGSCNLASVGYCEHYVGGAYTQNSAIPSSVLETACKSGGGVWSGGGCPDANTTGRCVMAKGALNEIVVTYYSSKYANVAAAQKACSEGIGGNAPGAGVFQNP